MGSMNAFLKWHSRPETPALYDTMHARIDAFVGKANKAFKTAGYPLEREPRAQPRAQPRL